MVCVISLEDGHKLARPTVRGVRLRPGVPWCANLTWQQQLQPVITNRKRGSWLLAEISVELGNDARPSIWRTYLQEKSRKRHPRTAVIDEAPVEAPQLLERWLSSPTFLRAMRSRVRWFAANIERDFSSESAVHNVDLAVAAWELDDADQRTTAIQLAAGGWTGTPEALVAAAAAIHS